MLPIDRVKRRDPDQIASPGIMKKSNVMMHVIIQSKRPANLFVTKWKVATSKRFSHEPLLPLEIGKADPIQKKKVTYLNLMPNHHWNELFRFNGSNTYFDLKLTNIPNFCWIIFFITFNVKCLFRDIANQSTNLP